MTNRSGPIPSQIHNTPEPPCDCNPCGADEPSVKPLKPLRDTILVKPGSSKKGAKKKEEKFDWGPEDEDEDLQPCNIIIRNIRAVSTMSRTMKEARLLEQQNINRLNAWPRNKRWCKKKKKPIPKKSSLLDVLKSEKDCKCELVARATRANVHTRLNLAEHRDAINKSVSEIIAEEIKEEVQEKK